MYDELVNRLRMRANLFKKINQMENCIMDEAADAIQELQKRVPPVPHGRLIDADKLKTAFPCGESVRTECVRATIDYAPTIIPAEEG